jgi:hypothetical protein
MGDHLLLESLGKEGLEVIIKARHLYSSNMVMASLLLFIFLLKKKAYGSSAGLPASLLIIY